MTDYVLGEGSSYLDENTFVRLSNEEIEKISKETMHTYNLVSLTFAMAIEDALITKNSINKSDPDSIDLQSRCRGDKL